MERPFERAELLLGKNALERLQKARVAVFGLGGVGGYVVEGLARCGVGALDLVDRDIFSISNLNRQILATTGTIGRAKVEAAKERVLAINPDCRVNARQCFFLPDTKDQFDFREYDYVVDAIDTVTGKLALIETAREAGVPIISSMGTGNKLDPTAFRIGDIYETTVCPLARVMRRECRKRGIDHLKVLYSTEIPLELCGHMNPATAVSSGEETQMQEMPASVKPVPGSVSFVPSVAGLIIAGEVIKDLIGYTGGK